MANDGRLIGGSGKCFSDALPNVGMAVPKVSGYTQLTEEIAKAVVSVRDRVNQVERTFSPVLRPEATNQCCNDEAKEPVRSDFEAFVVQTIRELNQINDRLACIVDRSSI